MLKTAELKTAIKTLLPATSQKELVLQLAHIVFNGEELLAYNDRISVAYPFNTGIKASVPAEDLNKIISGISEDEIEISVSETEVTIKSASTEATISTEMDSTAVEQYFSNICFDDMNWHPLPKSFMNDLALSRLTTATNALDPKNLHCVSVSGDKVRSGDGYRLSEITMTSEIVDNILIPASSIAELLQFSNIEDYALANNWIHFATTDDIVISCRLVVGDYPDFSKILKNFKAETDITISQELLPILLNLSGLVEGASDFMKSVHIELNAKNITVTGRKDGLRVKKTLKCANETEVVFDISPVSLAHFLQTSTKMSICGSQAVFSEPGKFINLLQLPVR